MTLEGAFFVLLLTALIQLFFGLALESRSLVRASYLFAVQAALLVLVFMVYAVVLNNPYLYIWAAVVGVLNVGLLPFLPGGLLYSAERMPPEERVSPVGTIAYVVLLVVGLLIVGSFTRLEMVVADPTRDLRQHVSVNLVAALSLFGYGVIVLLSHRHPFKMVIGLMMMTEAAHLTLVSLAPAQLEVVKIGILTQVVPSIFAVLYVNRLIAERLKVTDTAKLSDLRY